MRLDELAARVATPARWRRTHVRRIDERAVELSFACDDDWLRVRIIMEPTRERCFRRWERCAVRYEGRLARPDARRKEEVSAILESAGVSLDAWLAEAPARTFAALDVAAEPLATPRRVAVLESQAADEGDELKLNVNSPCGQSCEFCAIATNDIVPSPLDGLLARVDAAARRGVRSLRVTGIDPMTFEGLLELLRHARDAGFENLELHGPSKRLADEAFCRLVLEAAPARRWFHVPLYGGDPATHDAVVGVEGAFDRVMAALDNLARLEPKPCVTIHTVCTRRVLPALPAIVALVRQRSLGFAADLPFPEDETQDDPFQRVAARQHDVADALIAAGLGIEDLSRVSGLWPCALHSRLDISRAARLAVLADERSLSAPSIGVRTPMMRCPHAETCRWVPACSGEILRAYVLLHGDRELAPR